MTELKERVSELTGQNSELKTQLTRLALAGAVLADRLHGSEETSRMPDNVVRFPKP
ncbi:hypothetical protein [Kitasatospora sp. NPDC093806]|uniref:hypothetical protein n=1 Tax=Kitasatospora sp. NPDC093806 TaxID=3155075 RepID=UPI00342C326C